MKFNLVWEIEVEAETSVEALRTVLNIMRDRDSTATIFSISKEEIDPITKEVTISPPKLMDAADYAECSVCSSICTLEYDFDYPIGYKCSECDELICHACLDNGRCRTCLHQILEVDACQ